MSAFAKDTIAVCKLHNRQRKRGSGTIPVVGYVGAGAEVIPYDDMPHGEGIDSIERPFFVKGKAVAVEVKGDSLLPVAEDGWRLIYNGEQDQVEDEVLNRICVATLEDGRVLVKRIMRGAKPQVQRQANLLIPPNLVSGQTLRVRRARQIAL